MVSIYLMGGLSNMMFQIAMIYSLAKENNVEFAIDFEHGEFTQKPGHIYRGIIYKNIKEMCILPNPLTYLIKEPSFSYNKVEYKDNTLYRGYYQSEKYFINYKNEIIDMFSNEDILNELKNKYKDILSNSLSIHVRRGDYMKIQNFHPFPGLEYYTNSIKYIDEKKKIDKILVFSDDMQWCKSNLTDNRIIFIENQKDYEDLYLMSLCENNIIANSSFSWWGSYLNKNNDKIVCAPKTWFGLAFKDNWNDLYYEKTIII
jgi:hypothetical protein